MTIISQFYDRIMTVFLIVAFGFRKLHKVVRISHRHLFDF